MARRHNGRKSGTASTSKARATGGGAARASVYASPWLVWLSLPLIGAVFWALTSAGKAATFFVAVLLTVGSLLLVGHTYSVFAKRRDARVRWDAAITVGLACVWIMCACAFGLFHNPHVDVWPEVWRAPEWLLKSFTLPIWGSWLGGGIIVAVAWNIRRAAMTTPENEDQGEEDSALTKALDGAKLKQLTSTANGQVTGRLEGRRGEQTSDDLQKLAGAIESANRLREGSVRIAKDPKDRGAATIVITPHDPLEGDTAWPGPSRPGGHLADAPIPFSVAEDGEIGVIWFNGDEAVGRNLVHYLVEGANGSGKSMGWRAAIADAMTRTAGAGVRLHGVDVSGKWRQTFGPLIPYMTNLAKDAKSAKKLVRDLSGHVAAKQERMGAAGFTQWSPDCGEPFEIFWIEEGSEIAAESQEITRAAERWRSAGVMLIIVIQRASWDNIDTTTRSQLGGATAFGVNDGGQSTNCLSLPSIATDQGADPARWGSRHPGRHYLITSTTPEERMAIPHKSFKTTNDEVAAALAAHCKPIRDQDGEVLGQATPAAAPSPQPTPVWATPPQPAPAKTPRPIGTEWIDTEDFVADEPDDEVELPRDPDPALRVSIDEPIRPPAPEANLPMSVPGAGGPKVSEAAFKKIIQQHLEAIVRDGRDRTQAADVHRMRPETGYSRESVRLELVRLCNGPHTSDDRFRLTRDDADRPGVYQIYIPQPANAV